MYMKRKTILDLTERKGELEGKEGQGMGRDRSSEQQ